MLMPIGMSKKEKAAYIKTNSRDTSRPAKRRVANKHAGLRKPVGQRLVEIDSELESLEAAFVSKDETVVRFLFLFI